MQLTTAEEQKEYIFDFGQDSLPAPTVWKELKAEGTKVSFTEDSMVIALKNNKFYLPYLLHTKDLFSSLYGSYEIRVKFHDNDLAWQGFWLLDHDEEKISAGNKWRDDVSRIEVFTKQMQGDDTFIGLSWDSNAKRHPIYHKKHHHEGLSDGFQVFRLEWTPESYRFTVNDELISDTGTLETSTKSKYLALFLKQKGEKKELSSSTPVMEVDYIRVKSSDLVTKKVERPISEVEMRMQGGELLPVLPQAQQWKEVFSDDFSGESLDTTKWSAIRSQWRKGGWWRPENVSLNGEGQLVITTAADKVKPEQFATGGVTTRGKFEHGYGFYTARVKFQQQVGHWSAFWLQNTNFIQGNDGVDGAEIDVFEKAWLEPKVDHGIHFDGYGQFHGKSRQIVDIEGINEGYHDLALWWTPEEYIFFCNGKETYRTSIGGINQKKNFMLLTCEIGKWAGDIQQANLPDYFMVDEVKVFTIGINE